MTSPAPTPSTSSPPLVLGRVQPRLWTPPLRDLSEPAASWGYDFIAFCALIGWPLDLWQVWLAVHLGELFPDGSPRFRKAIILVARQNGKTVFCRLLILFWMFVERVPEIVGTSTDRSAAKRSWWKVIEMAESSELLAAQLPAYHVRKLTAEEDFWNDYGSHYRFAASNSSAGRGDTLPRALLDELRQHKNRDTWDAVVPATAAVGDGLTVCISNEGDASSVVLHEEYDAAEGFILTGEGDPNTFLAAWSSPSSSDPTDLDALAYANPSLNRVRPNGSGIRESGILGDAITASRIGGDTLARFKIERMCMRVDLLESAIRIEDWNACGVPASEALDLAPHRRSVAVCFDVAQDASHATLTAVATLDGVSHIEVVKAWQGYECRKQLRAELPDILRRIKPRKCVWFPGGPAAAVADEWRGRRVSNVIMEEIRAEDVVRACMGLEEQAAAHHLRHAHDPLLDTQLKQTSQLPQGDGWRFARRGKAPIDAPYSAAGGVHAARQLPHLGPAV